MYVALVTFSLPMPDRATVFQTLIFLGYVVFIGWYLRRSIFTHRSIPGKWRLRLLYALTILLCLGYLAWSYLHQ